MTQAHRIRTALCVGQWLPLSETFIYDQVRHQSRTQINVIARDQTKYATLFPYEDVFNLGPLEQIIFYHSGRSRRVEKILRQKGAEVVHAHFGINGSMILPIARRLGLPLVVSFHGHDVAGLELRNRHRLRYYRYQKLAHEMFTYAARLLCASSELAEMLVHFGAPEKKVHLHHLGIDVDTFSPDPSKRSKELSILCVGRLVEKKGLSDAIEAFSLVLKDFPQTRLKIVGEGPLKRTLQAQCAELHLESRVDFLGALNRNQVLQEMRAASIMLTPSITAANGDRESGVIVLKEAGAVGLPTVATQHGGIPEIIVHGRTGFLHPERDVEGLALSLGKLLASSKLREAMGEAARRLICAKYDAQVQNKILEEHLAQAVEAARA